MSTVPYIFANQTGSIPLNEIDANFANVKANVDFATAAGTVTTNSQPNITSVGTLTSLTVSGNIIPGGIKTDGYYYANGTPFIGGGGAARAESEPKIGSVIGKALEDFDGTNGVIEIAVGRV